MRSQSKRLSTWMGLLIPGALLFAGCSPAATVPSGASVAAHEARTITVVGQGEATAKPDIAQMNLGIEAMAPTVSDALRQANTQMTAIIAAVKKAGIPDKDIHTSNFSINFERPYQPPGPVPMAVPTPAPEPAPAPAPAPAPRGAAGKAGKNQAVAVASPPGAPRPPEPYPTAGVYRVSNMIAVTVRDPSKAGEVLEAGVNAGANNVWNVSFALDNTKVVEAQAREKAVADARARAEELARLSGVTLGPIQSVSTIIGMQHSPMPMPMMASRMADSAPPLEMGELSWNTQVQVVFEFSAPKK